MLRVPYTFNPECIVEDIDLEVRVIQELDYSKTLPFIDNLLIEIMTFLAHRKLKINVEIEKRNKIKNNNFLKINNSSAPTIPYIEKLLDITLSDYRKNAIYLILVPYLLCKYSKFIEEESFSKIKQWILKYNDVETLKLSIRDFDIIINKAIKRAKVTDMKP